MLTSISIKHENCKRRNLPLSRNMLIENPFAYKDMVEKEIIFRDYWLKG